MFFLTQLGRDDLRFILALAGTQSHHLSFDEALSQLDTRAPQSRSNSSVNASKADRMGAMKSSECFFLT